MATRRNLTRRTGIRVSASERLRRGNRAAYLQQPHKPYSDLVDKYSRRRATLQNMADFMREIDARVEARPAQETRAIPTMESYMAIKLAGRRDSAFLLRIAAPFVDIRRVVGNEIRAICTRRNVSRQKAARILERYVVRLGEKIDANKKPIGRECAGYKVLGTEAASNVKHNMFDFAVNSFREAMEKTLQELRELA